MLNRMRAARARTRAEAGDRLDAARAADANAFLGAPIAAMPAVAPPGAANDDPLTEACGEVERALKTAGYLR